MPRISKQEQQQQAEVKGQAEPLSVFPTVTIEVPLDAPPPCASKRHIELALSGQAAEVLIRATEALQKQGATLQNGRRVVGCTATARWIFEQLAARTEA